MKLHARVLLQEVANELGFVGGEIVEDDMNLLPGRAQRYHFCEEGHEVAAGVAGRGSSVHAAGLGIQRGIQRKRAGNTRSRDARLVPAKAAGRGPGGRGLG